MILAAAMLAVAAAQTGNAAVDAFVADIAAGRSNAAALADEFVDKLPRCAFVSSRPGRERRRQDITNSVPPMPGIETIRPGQSAWEWDRIARDYAEALQGSGAIPPGPGNFLVRFADGRPNAYATPEQLRHSLAACRQAGLHSSASAGLIVHWTCAGSGALGSNVVMQLGGYADRIAEGRVWVGWPPDQLPDDARLW